MNQEMYSAVVLIRHLGFCWCSWPGIEAMGCGKKAAGSVVLFLLHLALGPDSAPPCAVVFRV